MQLGTAYLELAPSTRGLVPAIRREMGQVTREVGSAGAEAGSQYSEGFAGKVRGGLGRVMDGVLMGVGMKALDGLAGAARSVFDVAIGGGINRALNLEQAEAKLNGLGHSAESVATIMDSALGAVKGTAFGMGDAATVAASAVAAGIAPGKDLQRTLTLVGDAATIAGTDMSSMGAIFNKVAASNKVQMDVINQLHDAGVPALQMLSSELGVTAEEASKMASAGKIDFATFQAAMEEGLGGAAQESGKTFAGAIANTKAALGRVAADFAAPVLDGVRGLATAAIPMIDTVGAALKPVAEALGGWIERQVPRIVGFLEDVPAKFEAMGSSLRGVWDLVVGGNFTSGLFGLTEDSPIVGVILTVRDGIKSIVDFIGGAGSILFRGDFTGGIFGLSEDHPLVDALFRIRENFIGVGDWITTVGMPAFGELWGTLQDNLVPVFKTVGDYIFGTLVPYFSRVSEIVMSVLGPAFSTVVGIVRDHVLPILGGIASWIGEKVIPVVQDFAFNVIIPAFEQVAGFIRDRVLPTFEAIASWITEKVVPVVSDFADRVLIPAFEGIAKIVKWAWDEAIFPALNSFWDFLETKVGPAIDALWHVVVEPAFKGIGDIVTGFGEHWAEVWAGIQQAAAKPVNFVIDTVWNKGLLKVINAVIGLFNGTELQEMPLVSWGQNTGGTGGAVPNVPFANGGYTGDGGKHDAAGIVHRGEYVLTKAEVAAAGGPSAVEAWKNAFIHGYEDGGLVGGSGRTSYKGHTFSRLFASVLQLAERMAGTSFQISQGGFRPRTSYSGTSHQGDAVDIVSPITNAVITALRSSGVAAWDRTGKGNWRPHIHGVPLPGYGYAAGSAVWQAQDYLRGGDGLGGRDNGPRVNGVVAAGAAGEMVDTSGLSQIPEVLTRVAEGLGELTGPWGRMLADGFNGMVDKVADWAWDKVDDLGDGMVEMILGEKWTRKISGQDELRAQGGSLRGYASGTGWASPGLAWAGEHGPELINFRGGERVYDADQSASIGGGLTIAGDVIVKADLSEVQTLDDLISLLRNFGDVTLQHGIPAGV